MRLGGWILALPVAVPAGALTVVPTTASADTGYEAENATISQGTVATNHLIKPGADYGWPGGGAADGSDKIFRVSIS
jgi:hypothetical protein